MVLTNPTRKEIQRFNDLQQQGSLPSQALKKLETERRLGLNVEEPKSPSFLDKLNLEENWWYYGSLSAISIGILYVYIKARTSK